MKINNKINRLSLLKALTLGCLVTLAGASSAQSIEQVRWKGEDKVRQMFGEPQSTRGPIGTHASYTMWQYADFTVAFANKKAFHLFKTGDAKKVDLNEKR